MAKIKVDGDGHADYGVGNSISFSFVSSPADGRRQVKPLETCRDFMNDIMISFINNKGGTWKGKQNAPIDLNTFRLLLAKHVPNRESEERLRKSMYTAKRIINMYETLAGWKQKSVLSRVEHSSAGIKHCWLLTGPGEWMKATHLVSMVTLIFRVVIERGGFDDCDTLDKVEERFKKLCDGHKEVWSDLGDYLPKSWLKYRILMKKYNDLFGKFTHQQCNPASAVNRWHDEGGIRSFCTLNTGVAEITARTKEVFSDWEKGSK